MHHCIPKNTNSDVGLLSLFLDNIFTLKGIFNDFLHHRNYAVCKNCRIVLIVSQLEKCCLFKMIF